MNLNYWEEKDVTTMSKHVIKNKCMKKIIFNSKNEFIKFNNDSRNQSVLKIINKKRDSFRGKYKKIFFKKSNMVLSCGSTHQLSPQLIRGGLTELTG